MSDTERNPEEKEDVGAYRRYAPTPATLLISLKLPVFVKKLKHLLLPA
ncbi:MAG: hypothetical protein HZC41_19595 [Chloroflexi bacterium]|nr:hypothetical protein [Chloroflexota bacterium]